MVGDLYGARDGLVPLEAVASGAAAVVVVAELLVAAAVDQAEVVQVEAGNRGDSPILLAIRDAEAKSSGEIRVHLSKRLWEPNPLKSAWRVFYMYGLEQTRQRNAVLLYVNLRHHKFAVIGDTGVDAAFGQIYWRQLVNRLQLDFNSTHFERAIASAVRSVGESLAQHFPADPSDIDELSNDVSRD